MVDPLDFPGNAEPNDPKRFVRKLDHPHNVFETKRYSAKPYPSLWLGAYEVIPLNLARAFCAFAAGAVLALPLSLK